MSALLSKTIEERIRSMFNLSADPTSVNCNLTDKEKYTEALKFKQLYLDKKNKEELKQWSIACAKEILFSSNNLNKHIDIATLPNVNVHDLSETASDFEYFETKPLDCYKNELSLFVLWSDFLAYQKTSNLRGRRGNIEDFMSDYDSTALEKSLVILYSYGVQLSFNTMSSTHRPPLLAAAAVINEKDYVITSFSKYIVAEQNKNNLYKVLLYSGLLVFYSRCGLPYVHTPKHNAMKISDIHENLYGLQFNVGLADTEFSSYTLMRCLNLACILFLGCKGKIDTLPKHLKAFILNPTRAALNSIENNLHVYVTFFSNINALPEHLKS